MISPISVVQAPAWIRNQPVRRKLAWYGVIAAITAALAASAVLLAHALFLLRSSYRTDTLSTARIVAENAVGPVAFQDASAATAVLSSLRAKPTIRGAAIDLPGRPDFATYGVPPSADSRLRDGRTDRFEGWLLHTSAPIGDRTGATVHVVSDLGAVMWETVRAFGIAVFGGLLLALILSTIVSGQLRQFILVPVENLHRVAGQVAAKPDFAERAVVLGQDELGRLTEAFNRMLDRLQENDVALRASNDGLNREIANRQRLETELIKTSRMAGMAEVATGVLHNVGNVLNSVNVSANILRDRLRSSGHFGMLQRAVDLLREHGDNLPRFLAEDPRGKQLTPFLIKLGEHFTALQEELLRETDALSQNIDHIKQVVSVQQRYARAGGVTVKVSPVELFDAATRIVESSVATEGIALSRDFATTPEVLTDRDQVLQIIVNFLTNAVAAVKSQPPGARRIHLAIARHPSEVDFIVEDNGVGIAAENLHQVFQHGFTTRKDGHGFGLHSGALAAKNLNGRLRVHSDGVGRGARFTLTLPLTRDTLTQAASS